jgi:hypothetical protein
VYENCGTEEKIKTDLANFYSLLFLDLLKSVDMTALQMDGTVTSSITGMNALSNKKHKKYR